MVTQKKRFSFSRHFGFSNIWQDGFIRLSLLPHFHVGGKMEMLKKEKEKIGKDWKKEERESNETEKRNI